LVKMDIASMANSLEARSPFLDHKVMEYCARLPTRFKQRRGTLKYLLRRIGRDLLPREILSHRKMGFGLPLRLWMHGELGSRVERELLCPESHTRPYFEPDGIRRLLERHCTHKADHSRTLWALYCLELWHREFLTN